MIRIASNCKDGLQALLESGKYSDFRIICGDKIWHVHKAIICPQSAYFTALCDSKFKEAQTGEVDLSEERVDLVEGMLNFLYTTEYQENPVFMPFTLMADSEIENGEALGHLSAQIVNQLQNIRMYAMGDKYMIKSLTTYAAMRFSQSLPHVWQEDYWTLIDEIHHTTTEGSELQKVVLEWWFNQSSELLRDPQFRQRLMDYREMEIALLRLHTGKIHEDMDTLLLLPNELDAVRKALATAEFEAKTVNIRIAKLCSYVMTTTSMACARCPNARGEFREITANDDNFGLRWTCCRCHRVLTDI